MTTRTKRAGVTPGPVGWDPMAQGLDRTSGVIPIGAKGVEDTRVLYYTTRAEFVAGLIALLHPEIATIGRADMSDAAARNRGATGPFGARVPIRYVWEDEPHWYLPDFVGRTPDGRPVVIEAGISANKGRPKELAKLEAGRAWAAALGGALWVVAADLVPARWVRNALPLYLCQFDFRGDADLLDAIRAAWRTERVSIQRLIERFADRGDRQTVVAACRQVAGNLLAEGRLDLDLATTVLSLTTPIGALRAATAPVEPAGILRDLGELARLAAEQVNDSSDDELPADRPDIDPDAIGDPAARSAFLRRRAAIAEILAGCPAAVAARRHRLPPRRTQQLVAGYRAHGERALLPYARVSARRSATSEALEAKIGALYRATQRPSIAAIVANPEVHALAQRLAMPRSPTWYQVDRVVRQLLLRDQATRDARAGRRLEPLTVTGRAVTTEVVPGNVCEFDEGWLDVKVLALPGAETTIRLHIGILIDVATRYPLSVVVSPKPLDQWDVRRAVLRALLPDDVRKRFEIRTPAPGPVLFCLVRTDNGRIEVARLTVQMAGDLPFVLEWAPRRDPHAKPVVESVLKVFNNRFIHRLAITTKQSPEARGVHDPAKVAIAGAIDADAFERALMQFVFEVYATEWHGGLRERPEAVLADALERFPVRVWMGTPDELRRRLRRDEGTRLVDRHGVSYKGEWYGAAWLGDRLGTRVRIKVDEDDVRTLDVYDLRGAFLGAVRSERVEQRYERPVSRWELVLERQAESAFAKVAHDAAAVRQQEIVAELETPDRKVARASRRRHHGRRAAETAMAASTAADIPASPARPVQATLARPTAEDADYPPLT